jgi:DNA-directed RNA polymerase subunit RPC12/RpoP
MKDEAQIKICSSCGEEYSPDALTCADCGGRLVFASVYQKPLEPLVKDEANILIRQGQIKYLRELEGLLRKNRIRSEIRFHGCEPGT